jgi:hypothetical protein
MKGRYANMWRKQIRAERAAEAASFALAKAEALQKAALERPGSSGNHSPSEDVSENEADSHSCTVFAVADGEDENAGTPKPKQDEPA